MDLALVGLVLPNVENHSLGVLDDAARRAGYATEIVPFSGWADLDRAARAIARSRPRWCGISIQTGEVALAALSLARILRQRGYAGRIACGGHFATLNADEILGSRAGVDVVVRYAGEDALVALLGVIDDDAFAAIPGVVGRSPDGAVRRGPPPRVIGQVGLRPPARLGALPTHLGLPACDLVVSHGCEHTCSYCCVAAVSAEARRELGDPRAAYERRSLDGIADEIASAYHAHDARVFNFMDDNVLPTAPAAAAEWAGSLSKALAARDVGRIALSMQLRADAVSPESARALAALGLVRAYVGIDGYSRPQLVRLGRHAEASAGPSALLALRAAGILPIANALLIGPTIRESDLRAELAALASVRGGPVHLLPIEARAGTAYFDRAAKYGLVEGSFVFRHTRFLDARVGRVGRVIAAMPTRLEERSVPIGLYDLAYNLGIAKRMFERVATADLENEWAAITEQWNRDQVRLLGAALDAAHDDDATRELIERERPVVRAHDDALLARCDGALARLERDVARAERPGARAHARGRMMAVVAASMSLVGCYRAHERDVEASVPPIDAARIDVGNDVGIDVGPDVSVCPDDRAPASNPADNGCVPFCAGPRLVLSFDGAGVVRDISLVDGMLTDEIRACLDSFFAGVCYPSLAGSSTEIGGHCWVA